MAPPRRGRRRAAVSWYYTVIQLFGHGAGVQAWPRLPADDGGVRQLAERRDNANREYQLARAAYERGDFVTAEPLFRKALEFAPEFPEPHFALAQLMQRLGRNEEAQHFMAQVHADPMVVLAGGTRQVVPDVVLAGTWTRWS